MNRSHFFKVVSSGRNIFTMALDLRKFCKAGGKESQEQHNLAKALVEVERRG